VKNRVKYLWVMLAVLALAGGLRFANLSHAAVRSDEISFLFRARQNPSLIELWKNPPWLNQIPLADSVPVLWVRLTRQAVDEGVLRQPFALLGWLTVAFCCGWMIRRRGLGAGLLLGVWLAVLPYHVYHSREAYYYALVMLFSSGMALRGADFCVRLKEYGSLKTREYVEWTIWALMACLSHMSAWALAGVVVLFLALSGWRGMDVSERKRHALAMGGVVLVLGGGMIRWLWRAVYLANLVAEGSLEYTGSVFNWVGLRVIPVFMGGANGVGVGLLLMLGAAICVLLWIHRSSSAQRDPLYTTMTGIAICGILGSYVYIFAAGGGELAKLTFFAVNLPVFLAWVVMTLDKAFSYAGEGRRLMLDLCVTVLVITLLIIPAWKVTQLDGKPTAYRSLRTWLDSELVPGDVVLIDRWLEPWNEMALYAPSNVTVTFTVPDDSYDDYVRFQWRKVTKEVIQNNGAQAFIRIARNQEKRIGLWTWPERWFHHRAAVTNEAGLWLRDTGFAPMEEFYSASNRVVTEIFYDTHEDIVERARRDGKSFVWFYGEGWRLFKPWRQGDFSDYRILEREGELTVYNLQAEPVQMQGTVMAAASAGSPVIQIGQGAPLTFASGHLAGKPFKLVLQPGPNSIPWKQLNQAGVLLVRELQMDVAK